jgi:hypothetical protein
VTGTLAAYGSGTIMVHFNTAGLPYDTLSAFLTFSYGNEKSFQVPVHVFIISSGSELSLNISTDHQVICEGDSAHLTSSVFGGSGAYTYSWTSAPAGFIDHEANVTVRPVETTTYFLDVSDGNGSVQDSIRISVNPLPARPVISTGPATVDNYLTTSSTYSCDGTTNAVSYHWTVTPAEAGTTTSTGTSGEFTWTGGFTGAVLITVVGINDCGNSQVSDAFATLIYSSEGISENGGDKQLIIYPNPTQKNIHVRLNMDDGRFYKDLELEIYNINGQNIKEINMSKGEKENMVSVEGFEPGIYTAVLKEGSSNKVCIKFIVTK